MCDAMCDNILLCWHSTANVGMQPVTSNQTGQPSQPGKLYLHNYFIFVMTTHLFFFQSVYHINL